MSVNGDLMVIRNGRSTSQVSVYNYPEHLNPFYEDDNHKRLRFWQINKTSKDGQGRRNSFSLGGLKDMWAFKSFRLKKKSSSLGINKTSESPPPLRRDVFNNNNGYNTYDPRMRYTTGATNGTLASNNAFQRNAPYRSSLQDMRNTQPDPLLNGFGFNRNDRYRSTIQPASTSGTPNQSLNIPTSRRYVYRGSVTPQPVRNNLEFNSDSLGMISHGSSQISVASTNPFDDEDDDDVVMGGNSAASTPAKHPARKKRRAPPPPIPVHQIIKEESSSAGSTPSHKPSTTPLKITEPNEDERLEIHNLTAEIENFVKSSNTDSPENHEVRPSNSNKQNGSIPTRDTIKTVHTNIDIRTVPDEEPLFIREDQDLRIEETPVKIQQNEVKQIGQVEAIHIRTETPRSTPERIESSGVSSFRSQTKPELSEKVTVSSSDSVVKVSETIKETPEKSKPVIAAKPKVPKSPPPVSPKSMVSSREVVLVETPDTPAMRREEIRTVEVINSSPETPHREVGVDVVPQRTSRQEVTISVTRIVPINDDAKKQDSPSEPAPVPVKRVEKHLPTENTPPPQEINKVVEKAAESSPGTSSKTEAKLERKPSNREEDLPTTISELQLIISEIEEVAERVEESAIQQTEEPDSNLPQPVAAITPPSTSRELSSPPPIQKPPRTKHFAEEINENIYRPRPSQWKQSTLAPLEPVPPEKRRSVKQIIESINRNQQRLGVAKKEEIEIDANNPQRNQSETNTNAMEQNLKSLAESQREMKRMLLELEGLQNAHEHEQKLSNKNDENFQGILDTIVSTLAKETGKNTNGEVFKKCTITKEVNNASRESSPTTSNLDWNPVPKPKRTNKNLSPELPVKRNNKDE